jgi:hypothetical protein
MVQLMSTVHTAARCNPTVQPGTTHSAVQQICGSSTADQPHPTVQTHGRNTVRQTAKMQYSKTTTYDGDLTMINPFVQR